MFLTLGGCGGADCLKIQINSIYDVIESLINGLLLSENQPELYIPILQYGQREKKMLPILHFL